ncbi:LysR family transcriptional regulator [Bosea sp. NPDC003192]|uniref:LysR family transcriptional regulator n=1 Tax=Bosea sp. NPDC003192 TaxID=3390551 RepID=UPI003D022E4A
MALPPLKALQAFEAVARLGSVSDAAAELFVTPGAISQQIKKLESSLGIRLVERNGRGVELTSWGAAYHLDIVGPFAALRQAQATLHRKRAGSGLVVSCLATVASRWLGPQLFDWQVLNPASKIRLIGAESEPRLFEDGVDFRLSYGSKSQSFDHYAPLFTDWVVPACAPGLIAGKAITAPEDIFAYPLIGIEWEGSHKPPPGWDEWADSVGVSVGNISTELAFSLSSTALDAAVNGRGFVLAQIAMIREDLASGRLVVPIDRRLQLGESYFLAWDRAALEKPFGGQFRDWVLAMSRAQQRKSAAL